jgi:hypothetical protein
MNQKRNQYRPVLSLSELEYLRDNTRDCTDTVGTKLHRYLTQYIFKINVGLNSVAYERTGTSTIAGKLGLGEEAETSHKPDAAGYLEKLKIKESLGGMEVLSKEDQYNLLAGKAVSGEVLTEEQVAEGKKLEFELYSMDLGTFTIQPKGN